MPHHVTAIDEFDQFGRCSDFFNMTSPAVEDQDGSNPTKKEQVDECDQSDGRVSCNEASRNFQVEESNVHWSPRTLLPLVIQIVLARPRLIAVLL